MNRRPKTGEPRKTRQPFAIDALPRSWRDKIVAFRDRWVPWEKIAADTATWAWETLTPQQLLLFPKRRIPHTTLHRWYDVRIEQLRATTPEHQVPFLLRILEGMTHENKIAALRSALAQVEEEWVREKNA